MLTTSRTWTCPPRRAPRCGRPRTTPSARSRRLRSAWPASRSWTTTSPRWKPWPLPPQPACPRTRSCQGPWPRCALLHLGQPDQLHPPTGIPQGCAGQRAGAAHPSQPTHARRGCKLQPLLAAQSFASGTFRQMWWSLRPLRGLLCSPFILATILRAALHEADFAAVQCGGWSRHVPTGCMPFRACPPWHQAVSPRLQNADDPGDGTPRAPMTVFRTFPQLPRLPSALASGGSRSARRVQLQPAPTEDPAQRLDQAVSPPGHPNPCTQRLDQVGGPHVHVRALSCCRWGPIAWPDRPDTTPGRRHAGQASATARESMRPPLRPAVLHCMSSDLQHSTCAAHQPGSDP